MPQPPGEQTALARQSGAYRAEIQGLRAFAVLLVAVYHVWFGRVSGGVDVFLLLTGFFITGSLVRGIERDGRLRPITFLSRLAHRLLPTAAVVLLGVLIMSWLLLSPSRLFDTVSQTIASGLYFENWALAMNTVDYLARDRPMSPLQHFWSLSIQAQFYLAWLALLALVLLAAKTIGGHLRKVTFAACALVFAASLTYSVIATARDQAWAYFDTGARLWEFALGGMLAMALPFLRLPLPVRIAAGWTGIAALIACGAMLDVSGLFPGWIALWPVGAAVLVILAGTTGSRWAADRLLTWWPLTALGDRSYALYLWHWPILIVYLSLTARATASVPGGLAVLAIALAAAFATKWLVEDRVAALHRRRFSRSRAIAVAVAFLAPVVGTAGVAQAQLAERQERIEAEIAEAIEEGNAYPGAAVIGDPALAASLPEGLPFIPPLENIKDVPYYYDEGCDSQTERVCVYGDPNGEHTIALVGASRIGHWFPAFERAALDNGWRLLVLTKSSCQFSTGALYDYNGEFYPACHEWNRWVLERLEQWRPDLAVTLSTRAMEDGEHTFSGFVNRWHQLDHWGIDVLALRDLPLLEQFPEECLTRHDAEDCVQSAEASQSEVDPSGSLENVPDNVAFADFTGYVCPDRTCPAVIGNVLTYRDKKHLTATYAETMAPYVEETVKRATGW